MVTVSKIKPDKVKKIQEILDKTPFKWKRSGCHWYTHDKSLWTWLVRNCGDSSRKKKVPSIILNASAGALRLFFDAAMLCDGHISQQEGRTSMTYSTSSQLLADQMQEISLKLGYLCRVTGPYTAQFGDSAPCPVYLLRVRRQVPLTLRKTHLSNKYYKGVVWCVTVPNGLILTRRNGYPAIHGNSTMVAESPGVKEFEDYQELFSDVIKEMWRKLIQYLVNINLISADALMLEVEVHPAQLIARNRLNETQSNEILYLNEVISPQEWSGREGVSYEKMRQDWEEHLGSGGSKPAGKLPSAGQNGDKMPVDSSNNKVPIDDDSEDED